MLPFLILSADMRESPSFSHDRKSIFCDARVGTACVCVCGRGLRLFVADKLDVCVYIYKRSLHLASSHVYT